MSKLANIGTNHILLKRGHGDPSEYIKPGEPYIDLDSGNMWIGYKSGAKQQGAALSQEQLDQLAASFEDNPVVHNTQQADSPHFIVPADASHYTPVGNGAGTYDVQLPDVTLAKHKVMFVKGGRNDSTYNWKLSDGTLLTATAGEVGFWLARTGGEWYVMYDSKPGKFVYEVESMVNLTDGSVPAYINTVYMKSFHNGLMKGGGPFTYDPDMPRTNHNGATIVSPVKIFPIDWNNQSQLETWFDGSSETGNGCFVKRVDNSINVSEMGAKGDDATDDTKPILGCVGLYMPNSTVSSARTGEAFTVLFDDLVYKITGKIPIDEKNIRFLGNGTVLNYTGSDDVVFDIGNDEYLSDLTKGYFYFSAQKISLKINNDTTIGLKNRGYRRLYTKLFYVYGGSIGIETEGAWGASTMNRTYTQNTKDIGFNIKQRNNLLLLEKCAALGITNGIGFNVSSVDAENDAVTLLMCDAEGNDIGYKIGGNNISNCTLSSCWGESNKSKSIVVTNESGEVNYGFKIDGGQFDKDIEIGDVAKTGEIIGAHISTKLVNANLHINVTSGVRLGQITQSGSSLVTFKDQNMALNTEPTCKHTSSEMMPRYEVAHQVPYQGSDTRGLTGEFRWDDNFVYLNLGGKWHATQISTFGSVACIDFPSGAEPDTTGYEVALTNNDSATTITKFANMKHGQRIVLIGHDDGNTTIGTAAAKMPGNAAITLQNNEIAEFICRYETDTPIVLLISYSQNAA